MTSERSNGVEARMKSEILAEATANQGKAAAEIAGQIVVHIESAQRSIRKSLVRF